MVHQESPSPENKITDEEMKKALKDALKEWMDERYLAFAKWVGRTLAGIVLTALVYTILKVNGITFTSLLPR